MSDDFLDREIEATTQHLAALKTLKLAETMTSLAHLSENATRRTSGLSGVVSRRTAADAALVDRWTVSRWWAKDPSLGYKKPNGELVIYVGRLVERLEARFERAKTSGLAPDSHQSGPDARTGA